MIVSNTNAAAGKITADRMPPFSAKPPLILPETNPISPGPLAHPISPASASTANIDVPPCGRARVARLSVPGQ